MIIGDSTFNTIINTFHSLEGTYQSNMKNKIIFSRVFTIGLIQPAFNRIIGNDAMIKELSMWLDQTCPGVSERVGANWSLIRLVQEE